MVFFFTYFPILVTFILNIRMKYGGSKLKYAEKCDFYAILTRNINGKLLKKLLKVVTLSAENPSINVHRRMQGLK